MVISLKGFSSRKLVAAVVLVSCAAVVGQGVAASAPSRRKVAAVVKTDKVAADTGRDKRETTIQSSVRNFLRRHRGKSGAAALQGLLAETAREVPAFAPGGSTESPWLKGIRQLAASLEISRAGAPKHFKNHVVKGSASPVSARVFPQPQAIAYRFGARRLVALESRNPRLKTLLAKGRVPKSVDLGVETRVRSLLHGSVPELELALAAVEQSLDVHRSRDRFAQFLETWRNRGPVGDESFYEALDRTAGTTQEVFFFDSMLSAFVAEFAGQAGKRWNRQQQHGRLQQSFLTYRQYRGLIEATAYAIMLPPDIPLPGRLARYDYGSVSTGQLSLRHELDLMAEFHGGDVVAVLNEVRDFLLSHPLPESLWGAYDPIGEFGAQFLAGLQEKVDTAHLSTDEIWEQHRKLAMDLVNAIRDASQIALVD